MPLGLCSISTCLPALNVYYKAELVAIPLVYLYLKKTISLSVFKNNFVGHSMLWFFYLWGKTCARVHIRGRQKGVSDLLELISILGTSRLLHSAGI